MGRVAALPDRHEQPHRAGERVGVGVGDKRRERLFGDGRRRGSEYRVLLGRVVVEEGTPRDPCPVGDQVDGRFGETDLVDQRDRFIVETMPSLMTASACDTPAVARTVVVGRPRPSRAVASTLARRLRNA